MNEFDSWPTIDEEWEWWENTILAQYERHVLWPMLYLEEGGEG